MSAFIQLAPLIALFGLLDWRTLRKGSKLNRYMYVILVLSAWAVWIYVSFVHDTPRIGNLLEKMKI